MFQPLALAVVFALDEKLVLVAGYSQRFQEDPETLVAPGFFVYSLDAQAHCVLDHFYSSLLPTNPLPRRPTFSCRHEANAS